MIYHVYRTKRDQQFGWALKGIETTIKAEEPGWTPTADGLEAHPHRGHIVAALPVATVRAGGDCGLFRMAPAGMDADVIRAYGTGQPAP